MSLCFLTQNYRHAYDLIQKLYPSLSLFFGPAAEGQVLPSRQGWGGPDCSSPARARACPRPVMSGPDGCREGVFALAAHRVIWGLWRGAGPGESPEAVPGEQQGAPCSQQTARPRAGRGREAAGLQYAPGSEACGLELSVRGAVRSSRTFRTRASRLSGWHSGEKQAGREASGRGTTPHPPQAHLRVCLSERHLWPDLA